MNTLLANPKQQTITIRVVFDGAAHGGKTTAVYSLAELLGSTAVSPDGTPGSTEWFDWLPYDGGQHDGDPLHVEVVAVPGTTTRTSRRRHLVSWGDVVIFVADTSPAAFDDSVEAFRLLKSDLLPWDDVPVVVLANKRDIEGAVSLEQLRSDLALGADDAVIESIASSGTGVREAFIYAVRAALASPAAHVEPTNVDDLLAELQASYPEPDSPVEDDTAEAAPLAMVVLSDAQLNPNGLDDGAVVLQPAHWRMLVDVAHGRTQLPLADGTDDAATAFELVSWGLIQGTESVVFAEAVASIVTRGETDKALTSDLDEATDAVAADLDEDLDTDEELTNNLDEATDTDLDEELTNNLDEDLDTDSDEELTNNLDEDLDTDSDEELTNELDEDLDTDSDEEFTNELDEDLATDLETDSDSDDDLGAQLGDLDLDTDEEPTDLDLDSLDEQLADHNLDSDDDDLGAQLVDQTLGTDEESTNDDLDLDSLDEQLADDGSDSDSDSDSDLGERLADHNLDTDLDTNEDLEATTEPMHTEGTTPMPQNDQSPAPEYEASPSS